MKKKNIRVHIIIQKNFKQKRSNNFFKGVYNGKIKT